MNCTTRVGLVLALSLGLATGCNKGETPQAIAVQDGVTNFKETDPNSSPVAMAAHDFVEAVVKGDTQRASARLTPEAIQRIVSSGKPFAPTGMETATFKLGEIRTASDTQAIVQCVLTDHSEATPHNEEMCCLLRKVDNDWRVCGIAYGTDPNKPWTLTDFESGRNIAIPRDTMSGSGITGSPANGNPQGAGPGQTTAVAPVSPNAAPIGVPQVGNPNAAANQTGTAQLGMPAVGAPAAAPYAAPAPLETPYTAQDPAGAERR
ncbi:MAG: hypothetical protein IT425_03155 [Pirellulales bacterium]|nr:hypothetical protein [Pirellulales bacterium]